MDIIQIIIDDFQSRSAIISSKSVSVERVYKEKNIIPKNRYNKIFNVVFIEVP
jgi:hypothetical protein